MPDPTTLYAFALTLVRIEITAGPNMAYLALLAASRAFAGLRVG